MTESETRAIVAVSLMAALADGTQQERERDEIRRIAEGLAGDGGEGLHLATLYQDVLMKRVSLESALNDLKSEEARNLAFEMAVCVCNADGAQTDAERRFLARLREAFAMPAQAGAEFNRMAESMATAPLAPAVQGEQGATRPPASVNDAELDKMILNAAITNGALELLPETLSTMAIIPLQMQLVYKIGKAHGYELDSGHIKDFLAAAGVGLASQYLEQAGRKLVGGILGSIIGSLGRGIGKQAVSSGMSFATTYALGQVAKRYYAGGREFSAQMLKDTFEQVMQQGKSLQGEYLPAIAEKAKGLDAGKVLAMVRGGS
jgi:uncharacterized protein (DUF697 family)/tellurite resistance protein